LLVVEVISKPKLIGPGVFATEEFQCSITGAVLSGPVIGSDSFVVEVVYYFDTITHIHLIWKRTAS
jgi:hypothetical protein